MKAFCALVTPSTPGCCTISAQPGNKPEGAFCMSFDPATLRTLHRIHRQIADLDSRIGRGPLAVKASEKQLQQIKQQLAQSQEAFTQARLAADQKQLQLQEREDRVTALKEKLNTCGTNREYQTLQEQINAGQQANLVLSDEILEMLESNDGIEQEVAAAKQKLADANAALEKLSEEVAQQLEVLNAELDRVKAELHKNEELLPTDTRNTYRRHAEARGEESLAEVAGGSCGNCMQTITPNMQAELAMLALIFCKACGALLYPAE